MAAAMPEWCPPPEPSAATKARLPPLKIYNSLTRKKDDFVPLDPEGNTIKWYSCGPTVYDDSHIGHARNYISADIILRLLRSYFKFNVDMVLNITDVDDKIILAARQQHLLKEFIAKHTQIDTDVLDTTNDALNKYVAKNLSLIEQVSPQTFVQDVEKNYGHVLKGSALANDGSAPGDKEAKIKMHIKTASSAAEALANPAAETDPFFAQSAGVLLPYLDAKYGSSIDASDHSIFNSLSQKYTDHFFDDMKSLNVLPPTHITKVTDYVPKISDFVKKIQDNGFAYEHEGSVYFDISAWEKTGGVYARLAPWSRNDKDLLADGEGSLTTTQTGFKRSPADFALWKASKPGEPSWDSPWGPGRPGWHIECSAMASDILKEQFDIHSGGIDLAFPHHDNELVQSEAYWYESGKENKQWVNYFIHMGHLGIQGSKMSKSLKNFTTIREALSKGTWTPRGLRIAFLFGNWGSPLEITEEVIKAGNAWEQKVDNFFLKALDAQSNPTQPSTDGSGLSPDGPLKEALGSAKISLHDALCDSFDTPTAMRVISDLITAYNSETGVSDALTQEIAVWITEMVTVFGLDASPAANRIGWSGLDISESAKPYVYPLAKIRDEVRRQAIAGSIDSTSILSSFDTQALATPPTTPEGTAAATAAAEWLDKLNDLIKSNASPKSYMPLCDELRDTTLWNLNIYLEDRVNQPALVRPLNASLRAERANRDALAALKLQKAQAAKEAKEKEEREKLEKGKLSHLEMFRTSEFSEWDEEGLPVKDKEGKEVAKSRGKKLRKDWERQKKLHEAWLATQKQGE